MTASTKLIDAGRG